MSSFSPTPILLYSLTSLKYRKHPYFGTCHRPFSATTISLNNTFEMPIRTLAKAYVGLQASRSRSCLDRFKAKVTKILTKLKSSRHSREQVPSSEVPGVAQSTGFLPTDARLVSPRRTPVNASGAIGRAGGGPGPASTRTNTGGDTARPADQASTPEMDSTQLWPDFDGDFNHDQNPDAPGEVLLVSQRERPDTPIPGSPEAVISDNATRPGPFVNIESDAGNSQANTVEHEPAMENSSNEAEFPLPFPQAAPAREEDLPRQLLFPLFALARPEGHAVRRVQSAMEELTGGLNDLIQENRIHYYNAGVMARSLAESERQVEALRNRRKYPPISFRHRRTR